jgi:hypothetical protein
MAELANWSAPVALLAALAGQHQPLARPANLVAQPGRGSDPRRDRARAGLPAPSLFWVWALA